MALIDSDECFSGFSFVSRAYRQVLALPTPLARTAIEHPGPDGARNNVHLLQLRDHVFRKSPSEVPANLWLFGLDQHADSHLLDFRIGQVIRRGSSTRRSQCGHGHTVVCRLVSKDKRYAIKRNIAITSEKVISQQ